MPIPYPENGFKSFREFYPYYLGEHELGICKALHFTGTLAVLVLTVFFSIEGCWNLGWLLPLSGYGPAWVGHFVFEKNRPATFKHPFYSLMGDFLMFWQLLTGRLSFQTRLPVKLN